MFFKNGIPSQPVLEKACHRRSGPPPVLVRVAVELARRCPVGVVGLRIKHCENLADCPLISYKKGLAPYHKAKTRKSGITVHFWFIKVHTSN